jgi:hypothetical protein
MDYKRQLQSKLVPFYLGEQHDRAGRMIQEIWAWDFEKLECIHDYIQWLFPLSEKSAFNPNAPVVNESVIQLFRDDPRLRQNLLRSLIVMLRFYGLQHHQDELGQVLIDQSTEYLSRKREWLGVFNHNYLRITRILKCLVAFGLVNEAQAFYECLQQIYREDSAQIGADTFQYWTNAVQIKEYK